MRMSWEQLKGLPVATVSGIKVGQVAGLIFDPESHEIVQYEVKQGLGFSHRVLLVSKNQVISLTAEKMLIEDLTGTKKVEIDDKRSPATSPTVTTLASTRED
ncbi:MAG: PRC-barrel domain-containing protein [Patescibacteria group bacterium]|jgi:uncharacterized protein YrrD